MFTSIILCRRVSLWSTVSFHIYFKRKRAIWKRIKSCKSCLGIWLFVTLNNVLSLPKKLDWCYHLPQIGTFSVPAVREFNILPQYLLVNVAPPLWHPVVEAEKLRMKYIQQGSSLLLFSPFKRCFILLGMSNVQNVRKYFKSLSSIWNPYCTCVCILIENTYFQSQCSPLCNQCRPLQHHLQWGCQCWMNLYLHKPTIYYKYTYIR